MQRNWRCGRPDFGNNYNRRSEKQRDCFHIISPRWRGQAISFWSGSTASKTLDYQRTNPREYQIVRTHTKKKALYRAPHLNNKQNKNIKKSSADRITTSLSFAHQRGKKKKEKNSSQISPYTKLTQTTGLTLGGQKSKGRKNSTLKPGKMRPRTQ